MRDYLSQMEIPNRYMVRMTSISSDNMFWISQNANEVYALDELEFAPSIQEWLKVKCGVRPGRVLSDEEVLGARAPGVCEDLAILNAKDSKNF